MGEESPLDNPTPRCPEWELAPRRPQTSPPRSLQFSMTTLLVAITAYAILFGLLRWAEVRSIAGGTDSFAIGVP